jgi:hypothetical protein
MFGAATAGCSAGQACQAVYQFAIDMGEENSYTPAAAQGVKAES